jgi:hypothetical protein
LEQSLILIGSEQDVLSDLEAINKVAAEWWRSQGYSVIETPQGLAVVGKNSLTGKNNETALSTSWDIPRKEKDFWFISSPTRDERFKDWKNYLGEYVLKCEEIEYNFAEEGVSIEGPE